MIQFQTSARNSPMELDSSVFLTPNPTPNVHYPINRVVSLEGSPSKVFSLSPLADDSGRSTTYLIRSPVARIDLRQEPNAAVAVDPKSLKARVIKISMSRFPKHLSLLDYRRYSEKIFIIILHWPYETRRFV